MDKFFVSTHFIKRLRERLNIPAKSALKFLYKTLRHGIRADQKIDESLRSYMMSTVYDGYYGIIYSRHLIIVSKDSNVAITIVDVPRRYWNLINKSTNKGEKYYDTRKRKKSKRELQNEWLRDNLD